MKRADVGRDLLTIKTKMKQTKSTPYPVFEDEEGIKLVVRIALISALNRFSIWKNR